MADSGTTKEQRRVERKRRQLRESEARWWQKVLFDLGKARAAMDSLSETDGEPISPLITLESGDDLDLEEVERTIAGRVEELHAALGQGRFGRVRGRYRSRSN